MLDGRVTRSLGIAFKVNCISCFLRITELYAVIWGVPFIL